MEEVCPSPKPPIPPKAIGLAVRAVAAGARGRPRDLAPVIKAICLAELVGEVLLILASWAVNARDGRPEPDRRGARAGDEPADLRAAGRAYDAAVTITAALANEDVGTAGRLVGNLIFRTPTLAIQVLAAMALIAGDPDPQPAPATAGPPAPRQGGGA